MAKIVKSNQQIEALRFINDRIKLIEKVNKMLGDDTDKCNLSVKVNNNRISLDESDFIIKVLNSLRKDSVNKINKKSNKFSIELDEKDREILELIEKEVEQVAEQEQDLDSVKLERTETEEELESSEDLDLEQGTEEDSESLEEAEKDEALGEETEIIAKSEQETQDLSNDSGETESLDLEQDQETEQENYYDEQQQEQETENYYDEQDQDDSEDSESTDYENMYF